MIKYIISFIVYTLAMSGVLLIGYVVYKKTMISAPLKKNSALKISDVLRLPDRKILYVIEYGSEKFLVASSAQNVSFIAKLKNGDIEKYLSEKEEEENPVFQNTAAQNHIMKSLLKELSDKNQSKRGNL